MDNISTFNTLSQFLLDNPVDNGITEEVYISKRIKTKVGGKDKPIAFKICTVSGEEWSDYQNQATTIGRHKKIDFDSAKFNELLVINHTVDPDFKSKTMIDAARCHTPEQLMYKTLLAGEISELAAQITNLSGFNQDLDELKKQAKNS